MSINAIIDTSKLEADLSSMMDAVKPVVLSGMAEQLHDIVIGNFGGGTGIDRPAQWPPLSQRSKVGRDYVAKVGRTYATLYETGTMANAVKNTVGSDSAKVSLSDADCPYATDHHYGNPSKNLPSRRVFPIGYDGKILPLTREMVTSAAQQSFEEAIK